jgi:hypothetical protein
MNTEGQPQELTLAAFEQVILQDLQLQQQKLEASRLAEQAELQALEAEKTTEQRRQLDRRDKIDIILIVTGFVIGAILIWVKLDSWVPETGPIPIAGVLIRRVLRI